SRDQTAQLARQHACQHDALRVAARQRLRQLTGITDVNRVTLDQGLTALSDRAPVDAQTAAERRPIDAVQNEVVGDRQLTDEPAAVAVGWDEAQTLPEALARISPRDVAPEKGDRSGARRTQAE